MQLSQTPGCKQPGVSLSIHAEANVPEQTFGQQPHPQNGPHGFPYEWKPWGPINQAKAL